MARQETVTLGSYTIGGSSDATAQLIGRFGIGEDEAGAFFLCQFMVNQTTSANLETACKAMLEALRVPNTKLTIKFSTNDVRVFDPDVSASTSTTSGFNQHPTIRKLEGGAYAAYNTATTRAFELRVSLGLPPNYSGAAGRATGFANLHYDVNDRKTVTISGQYTQITAKVARVAFTDAIDAFCTTRLGLIVPGAFWVITRRDPEQDDNFQNVLNFSRQFSEIVAGGRSGSTLDIDYLPSGQRLLMLSGTYLRTDATFGGGAATSTVNANHATTGAITYGTSALAALSTEQGGALTVGTNCEIVGRPHFKNNEQNDRCDFVILYRELLWKQSSAASGLDDPDIFLDSVTFAVSRNPTDDSPAPPTVSGGAVAGNGAPGNPSNPFTGTIEKYPQPPNAANAGSVSGSPGVSLAKRPADIFIVYRAIFAKSVTSMLNKFTGTVLPYLMNQWASQVGFPAMELVGYKPAFNPTDMTCTVIVVARSYIGPVVAFSATDSLSEDLGIRLSKAFAGTPFAYLVQQALPENTRRRVISVIYRTGQAFNIKQFASKSQIPGWVVVARSSPDKKDRVLGVPSMGVTQMSLTNEALVEDLVYVGSAVEGSSVDFAQGGAQGSDGGGGVAQDGRGGGPAAGQASGTTSNPATAGLKPAAPQSIFQKGGYVF